MTLDEFAVVSECDLLTDEECLAIYRNMIENSKWTMPTHLSSLRTLRAGLIIKYSIIFFLNSFKLKYLQEIKLTNFKSSNLVNRNFMSCLRE